MNHTIQGTREFSFQGPSIDATHRRTVKNKRQLTKNDTGFVTVYPITKDRAATTSKQLWQPIQSEVSHV